MSRATPLIVQKFGGTSVASPAHIRRAAERALRAQRAGSRVAIVVSAMSGETNRLLALASETASLADRREQDALAASGEQVVAALTAIALSALGGKGRSFLSHQIRILTDSAFGDARIREVETARLNESLDRGEIPVVAGFQGVNAMGNITTLGRGGSDTTAVALAASLEAEACEIYTDVDGVYTADPGLCPNARRIPEISYEQMLTLSSLGAKVLHGRSVALALRYDVPVHVRTSAGEREGSWVSGRQSFLEAAGVTALACDRGLAQLVFPGETAAILERLAAGGIPVDRVTPSAGGPVLTLRAIDVERAKGILETPDVQARAVARVSAIGLGMQTEPGILARFAGCLRRGGITIESLSASELSLSCLVEAETAPRAMRLLHDGFELDGKRTEEVKHE